MPASVGISIQQGQVHNLSTLHYLPDGGVFGLEQRSLPLHNHLFADSANFQPEIQAELLTNL